MKKVKTKKSKSKKIENIAAEVWSSMYFDKLSKLEELEAAAEDYMDASDEYELMLENKVSDLTARAESAEEMLVDVKEQLEIMTENRNFYLELTEEFEKKLKEMEQDRDYWHKCWEQVYVVFVKTQRGWCDRFLDWWGEK